MKSKQRFEWVEGQINYWTNQLAVNKATKDEIVAKLRATWYDVFDASETIKAAIEKVEQSTDYTWTEYSEIASYIRVDFSEFKQAYEFLKEYLWDNHYMQFDAKNDALLCPLGPNIVINEDGDVYDQYGGKFFLKKDDYKNDDGELDKTLRNQKIEEYMERAGYFLGVFRSDRYGNVFAVNTQSKC